MEDDTKIDGEPSEGLEELVKEGEKPDEEAKAGSEGGDGEETESDSPEEVDETDDGSAALEARFDRLEKSLDEKEAENVFLRGEIAKFNRREERVESKPDDEFNIDEIAKQLSNADGGKSAAKTIIELATKIAEKKFDAMRKETTNAISTSQQIREAKESDRQNVLNEFGDYLDDKDFADSMTQIFTNTNRAAGRYVPDSLFAAAATAKLLIDKKRAAKNGTKNGVKPARPGAPKNPVDADTHDYSKVVTIDGLPATDREKAAMKGALRKMSGVTEKQYVTNWLEENARGNA